LDILLKGGAGDGGDILLILGAMLLLPSAQQVLVYAGSA